MRAYTSMQVATLLNINPETVRRWIKSGLLKAEKGSNRTGYIIFESDLNVFISQNPKYRYNHELNQQCISTIDALDVLLRIREELNRAIDSIQNNMIKENA